jgi:hypothetical protein
MIGAKARKRDYEIPLVGGLSSKRAAVRQLMEAKLFSLAKKYLSQEQQDEAARRLKARKPPAEKSPEPRPEAEAAKPGRRKCELSKVQGEMKDIKKVFECLFLVELDFFTLSCCEATPPGQPERRRPLGRLLRSCVVGALLMVLSDPLMIGEQQTFAFVDRLAGSNDLTSKGKRRAILVKKLVEEDFGNSPDFLDRITEAAKAEICLQEAPAAGGLPKFEDLCDRLSQDCGSEAEACARLVKSLFVRFLVPASICVATDLPNEIEVSATVFDHTEIVGKAPRCGLIFLNEANKVTPFFGLLPAKRRFKENFLQASLDHHAKKLAAPFPAGAEASASDSEPPAFERTQQPSLAPQPQPSISISNRQFRQLTDFTFNQDPGFEPAPSHTLKPFPELFLEERRSAEFGKPAQEPPNLFAPAEPQPPQSAPQALPLIPLPLAPATATALTECAYLSVEPEEQAPSSSIQSLIQKYTESINSMLEMQRGLDSDGKISKMRRRFQKVELVKKMSSVLDLMDSNSQKIDLSISIVDSRRTVLQALQSRGIDLRPPEQPPLEAPGPGPLLIFSQPKPLSEVSDKYRLPPARETSFRYAAHPANEDLRYAPLAFPQPALQPQLTPRVYQPHIHQAYHPQPFDREATSFVQYPASILNTSHAPSQQSYLPMTLARSNSSTNFSLDTSAYPSQAGHADTRSYKDILPSTHSYLMSKNTYIRR